MTFEEFLRKIPKTDLHIHLQGAVRPGTLVELARKRGIALPARDPQRIYDYADFPEFLEVLRVASLCMTERDDFCRAAYELLEDAVLTGNCKHLELFFNPTVYQEHGVAYATVVDGLIDGMRAAYRDFGITCLLIPSIDREKSAELAVGMVRDVLADRRDEVAGIGIDFAEGKGPPERFVEAYRHAGKAGLKRTAHVCEDNQTIEQAPPRNVITCIELLGCDRLDHGYNVVADPEIMGVARDRDMHFCTVVFTANKKNIPRRPMTVRTMHDFGLKLNIGTDDPYLHHTDLGNSWVSLFRKLDWGVAEARELCVNGVDASWLPVSEKSALRKQFESAIGELEAQLGPR